MYDLIDRTIVAHIRDYIQKCGGWPSEWYVGIATDARQRLFGDHNVAEHGGYWIYDQASSEAVARATEAALLRDGYRGGTGGGREPRFVYAYKITNYTSED
ncbi:MULTISPECIES: hypothetical protein [Desulfovibrio]|uniref:hypothetical protein n=1 Tax=Desulfovibrio TaxID=872 RepID=UPI0026EE20E7|nr:hypothetical protein [Desulfovibrio piger]